MYSIARKVGDKITLADITVASALVYPMKLVMSPECRKAFPCVTRWFTTCVNQPQFKAVVGTVELAKEEMTAEGAPAVPKKEKKVSYFDSSTTSTKCFSRTINRSRQQDPLSSCSL